MASLPSLFAAASKRRIAGIYFSMVLKARRSRCAAKLISPPRSANDYFLIRSRKSTPHTRCRPGATRLAGCPMRSRQSCLSRKQSVGPLEQGFHPGLLRPQKKGSSRIRGKEVQGLRSDVRSLTRQAANLQGVNRLNDPDTLEKHRYAGVFSGGAFLRLCQWREIPGQARYD